MILPVEKPGTSSLDCLHLTELVAVILSLGLSEEAYDSTSLEYRAVNVEMTIDEGITSCVFVFLDIATSADAALVLEGEKITEWKTLLSKVDRYVVAGLPVLSEGDETGVLDSCVCLLLLDEEPISKTEVTDSGGPGVLKSIVCLLLLAEETVAKEGVANSDGTSVVDSTVCLLFLAEGPVSKNVVAESEGTDVRKSSVCLPVLGEEPATKGVVDVTGVLFSNVSTRDPVSSA